MNKINQNTQGESDKKTENYQKSRKSPKMTKIPPKSPKMTNFSGFSFWQVWKFKRLSHSVFVNSEKSRNRLFWSPLENPDVQKLINFLDRFWRFSGKTPKLKKPSYPRDVILEPRGSPEGVQKKGPKKGPKKGSPQIQGGPKTVKNGKFWKFQRLSHSVSVQKNQKKRTKSPGGLIGKIDFGGSKMGSKPGFWPLLDPLLDPLFDHFCNHPIFSAFSLMIMDQIWLNHLQTLQKGSKNLDFGYPGISRDPEISGFWGTENPVSDPFWDPFLDHSGPHVSKYAPNWAVYWRKPLHTSSLEPPKGVLPNSEVLPRKTPKKGSFLIKNRQKPKMVKRLSDRIFFALEENPRS